MGGRHTTGNGPIMTTDAGAQDLRMIHGRIDYRNPRGRSRQMTGLTKIGCSNVGRTSARGDYAIVTANARADDLGVVRCTRC